MTAYWFDRLPLHPTPKPLESFSSYLIRLADLNQIDRVTGLGYTLFPRTRYRAHRQGWYMDVPLNSFEYMPEATGCTAEQLQATTFHHLLFKLNRPTVFSFLSTHLGAVLRYCPACLAEQTYYRLPWRLLILPGCARHGSYLLDRCGHCGQPVPLVPFRPLRIGRCPTCGGDLSTCLTQPLSDQDLALTLKRTPDLEYLLTPQAWERDPGFIIPSVGAWLRFIRWELRLTEVAIAAYAGVTPPVIRGIETCIPRREGATLQTYFDYGDMLGVTWCEVFDTVTRQFQTSPADAYQLRSAAWVRKVEQAIQDLEQAGQPVNQNAIGRAVGLSPLCLKRYPGVDRIFEHLAETVRQKKEDRLLAAVQAAADQLRAQGRAVTQTAIRRLVPGCSSSTRQFPAVVALVEQVSDPSPYKASPEQKRQRDEALLVQAQQIVSALEAAQRRLTIYAVAAALDMAPHQIYQYPQLTAWLDQTFAHQRQREYQQREAELVARVQAVIQQLETDGQPVTQKAIIHSLQMTPDSLKRYPPVKALLSQLNGQRSWRQKRQPT